MIITKKIKMPEILSPAGSIESFYAAINNGADAVYLGGKSFNARASANNFSDLELEEAIDYAHRRNVKVYITLNTLYKNSEINECLKFADKMYSAGADAFIMQDIGLSQEVRRLFKEIKLHASTQMTIHSLEGAKYLESYGFDRVVLARELSLQEIRKINDSVKIETESFIHGALCVSYSGQCLMSSIIGTRSGNRGKCAQPCRMMYDLEDENGDIVKTGYLLSPRDIMTLEIMDEIVDSGVSSLKIEGRMKSPEYVGVVTKSYRDYLDNNYLNKKVLEDVTSVFNRGGYSTTGYYKTHSSKEMMSIETPKSTGIYIGEVLSYDPARAKNQKGKCIIETKKDLVPGDGIEIWTKNSPHVGTNISKNIEAGDRFIVNITGDINIGDRVYKSYDKVLIDKAKWQNSHDDRKVIVKGYLCVKKGEPIKIKLTFRDIAVEKCGGMVEKAQKQPLSEEKIISQFSKTGNTTYAIEFEKVDIDEDVFITISNINSLRRDAIEEFDKLYVKSFKRKPIKVSESRFESSFESVSNKEISVQVNNLLQLQAALRAGAKRVYYTYNGKNISEIKKAVENSLKYDAEVYLSFPKISKNDFEEKLEIEKLENTGIKGYLVSTYGQLNIIKENSRLSVVLDYTFNIFNSLSAIFFAKQGFEITLSQELNLNEIKEIESFAGEIVVFGRQVMMITNQCPIGIYATDKTASKHCLYRGQENKFKLVDRKNAKFHIYTDCNQCISYILNKTTLCMLNKLHDLQKNSIKYLRLIFLDESSEEVYDITKAYLNNEELFLEERDITHGHYYRGVD